MAIEKRHCRGDREGRSVHSEPRCCLVKVTRQVRYRDGTKPPVAWDSSHVSSAFCKHVMEPKLEARAPGTVSRRARYYQAKHCFLKSPVQENPWTRSHRGQGRDPRAEVVSARCYRPQQNQRTSTSQEKQQCCAAEQLFITLSRWPLGLRRLRKAELLEDVSITLMNGWSHFCDSFCHQHAKSARAVSLPRWRLGV